MPKREKGKKRKSRPRPAIKKQPESKKKFIGKEMKQKKMMMHHHAAFEEGLEAGKYLTDRRRAMKVTI